MTLSLLKVTMNTGRRVWLLSEPGRYPVAVSQAIATLPDGERERVDRVEVVRVVDEPIIVLGGDGEPPLWQRGTL